MLQSEPAGFVIMYKGRAKGDAVSCAMCLVC